jgi:hypothetical protein
VEIELGLNLAFSVTVMLIVQSLLPEPLTFVVAAPVVVLYPLPGSIISTAVTAPLDAVTRR